MEHYTNVIELIVATITRFLLYPFLVVFGAGSRISYDYYVNKKVPTKGQIFAILLMSSFVATIVYLTADAYGLEGRYKLILVSVFAFVGHTALTYLLENQEVFFTRFMKVFGFKKYE